MSAVKYYRFEGILLNKGWLMPAYVGIDTKGIITSIATEKPSIGLIENVEGYAIPGFQNAHSHAFQYAMAGLAEIHSTTSTPDDFWSWREAMYSIALSIGPEQMQAIATQLYTEMLRHGYTHVAEFHYVHHGKDGNQYDQKAEMGARLVAAAEQAGIKITLVPMFYQKGGFGVEATPGQRRFISSTAQEYHALLESSEQVVANYSGASLGFGFHSLRAVDKASMHEAMQFVGQKPIHIHLSEQLKEIEDCKAYYNARPVEWLYQQLDVNEQWHLVHCTHLDTQELKTMAKSGANAVICPSTEGNLGDGLFRMKEYIELNGRWSIGTDSHIGLDPKEELRLLDYGQRLVSHKRNTFYNTSNGDSGLFGFAKSLSSGRKAMGLESDSFFAVGQPLDAVLIDAHQALIASSAPEKLLSTYVYAGDTSFNLGTLVDGQWKIREGKHRDHREISKAFVKSLKELAIRL